MELVPGFDYYAVDKEGCVFRVKTRAGVPCEPRPIKWVMNGAGYGTVFLRHEGKTYQQGVHRLVAAAYIGDPAGFDVCHWNHNRADNRVENLYIGTRQENCKQSGAEGRYGKHRIGVKPACTKLTDEQLLEIKDMYATGKYKQVQLAKLFGVVQCRISQIIRSDDSGKAYPRRVL